MIDRTVPRFDLEPKPLAADTAMAQASSSLAGEGEAPSLIWTAMGASPCDVRATRCDENALACYCYLPTLLLPSF
jgi:hypothetical protein